MTMLIRSVGEQVVGGGGEVELGVPAPVAARAGVGVDGGLHGQDPGGQFGGLETVLEAGHPLRGRLREVAGAGGEPVQVVDAARQRPLGGLTRRRMPRVTSRT